MEVSFSDDEDDFSDLDFVNKIDFTKGFSSHHVQWAIKSNLKALEEDIYSNYFTTMVESENGKKAFSWYLAIQKISGLVQFRLFSKIVPTKTVCIVRLALSCSDKAPIFNEPIFLPIDQDDDEEWVAEHSLPLGEMAKVVGKEITFHCWIDLPKGIPRNANDEFETKRPESRDGLSEYFSKLFEGVAAKDPFSDVTLAIFRRERGNPTSIFLSSCGVGSLARLSSNVRE